MLGVPEPGRPRRTSRARTGSSRSSTTPTRTRATPTAEERFKEISAAHDVLGDAEKRKEYDEVREMVASGVGPGGGFGGVRWLRRRRARASRTSTFDVDDGGGLGDLLGDLFGGGGGGGRRAPGAVPAGRPAARRRPRDRAPPRLPRRGPRHHHVGQLHLRRGVLGVRRQRARSRARSRRPAPTCAGSGSVAVDQGPFSFSQVCPTCGGRGQVVKDKCKKCKGRGVERRRREVKVRIPAGVDDGQRIRVKGRGGAGRNGGPPGDLYVRRARRRRIPIFGRRVRRTSRVAVPVTFAEAALGAEVKVPTLEPTRHGEGARPARRAGRRCACGAAASRRRRAIRRPARHLRRRGPRASSTRAQRPRSRRSPRAPRRPARAPGGVTRWRPSDDADERACTSSRSRPSSPACTRRRCASTSARVSSSRRARRAGAVATPTATSRCCAASRSSPTRA